MGSYSIRDVSLVKQLDRARKDLDSLKGSQFVSRRGLATKKMESQLIESKTTNVSQGTPVYVETLYLRVTFIADFQVSPFGRLGLEFYDSSGRRLDSDSGISVLYLNDIVTRVDDGTLEWNLDVRTAAGGTIGNAKWYARLVVYATDTGRITWRPAWEG